MKENVIIIFDDKNIIVEGRSIAIPTTLPTLAGFEKLHAITWDKVALGDIQHYKDKAFHNTDFTESEYDTYVKPYVDLWEEQRIIEDTPTIKDLPQVKTEKIISINQEYASRVSQVKANTVQEEVDTWDIQRLEALAWETDSNALTPQLDLIALNRGIDRVEMVQKTLAKTKSFEIYVFTLLGQKQRLEDLVEQATTEAEVEAITWR